MAAGAREQDQRYADHGRTFTFTLQVTDERGPTAEKAFPITIS